MIRCLYVCSVTTVAVRDRTGVCPDADDGRHERAATRGGDGQSRHGAFADRHELPRRQSTRSDTDIDRD